MDSETSTLGLRPDSAPWHQANDANTALWDTALSIDSWDTVLTQPQCEVRQAPHAVRDHDCRKQPCGRQGNHSSL